MFKKAAGKAAASEEARRTLPPYVEPLSDARTPLGDFFNILLKRHKVLEADPGVKIQLRKQYRQPGLEEVPQ